MSEILQFRQFYRSYIAILRFVSPLTPWIQFYPKLIDEISESGSFWIQFSAEEHLLCLLNILTNIKQSELNLCYSVGCSVSFSNRPISAPDLLTRQMDFKSKTRLQVLASSQKMTHSWAQNSNRTSALRGRNEKGLCLKQQSFTVAFILFFISVLFHTSCG